jgi:nucleotide-binding universal stress UspA family protein
MVVRTLLVGTDLSERADRAIVRGHELAQAGLARLVVCHVGPSRLAAHTLFPQKHVDDIAAVTELDAELAEIVSSRVVQLTGRQPDAFEVVLDQGSPARALCEQSARVSADLIVVMADRVSEDGDGLVTRDLVRGCGCSVLILGGGPKSNRNGEPPANRARVLRPVRDTPGVAIVALEGEISLIPDLVEAARFVAPSPPEEIDVVLWVSEQDVEASSVTRELDAHARKLGVRLSPWFAQVRDTSLLMAQAAQDPSVGLLVFVAPLPSNLVRGTSSPIDDVLPEATSSILLLRVGAPLG